MKLSDTLEEQAALEALIEEAKPRIPEECRHLHFLLFTPFRYSPYPFDSRFRRAGATDGVFYASEVPETAVAEKAFFRLLFFLESPDTPWPANPGEYSAFAVRYAVARAADLTQLPWNVDRALWTHPVDYSKCLEFSDTCRAAGVEAIRYESIRDPASRANVALLTCRAFARPEPISAQTWHLHLSSSGVRAACESPRLTIAFARDAFAADPRIHGMNWDR